jgi:hypothetical protein
MMTDRASLLDVSSKEVAHGVRDFRTEPCFEECAAIIQLRDEFKEWRKVHIEEHTHTTARWGDIEDPQPFTFASILTGLARAQTGYEQRLDTIVATQGHISRRLEDAIAGRRQSEPAPPYSGPPIQEFEDLPSGMWPMPQRRKLMRARSQRNVALGGGAGILLLSIAIQSGLVGAVFRSIAHLFSG